MATYYEVKAATFNGNTVTAKGKTMSVAFDAAQDKAASMGTLIRKIISRRECVESYAEGKRVFTWKFPTE